MTKRKRAFIRCEPDLIPGSTGAETTVSWSTGNGRIGQVWVLIGESEERLFAEAPAGSTGVSWIAAGTHYTFRLYDGVRKEHLLADATVTRQPARATESGRGSRNADSDADAWIVAAPNPVPATEGSGATTISWSTGDGSPGAVFVRNGDGTERLFARAAEGEQGAPWISAGHEYHFTLYGDEERARPLATICVAMTHGQLEPRLGGRPEMHRLPASSGTLERGDAHGSAARMRFDFEATTASAALIQTATPLARQCRGGSQAIPLDGGYLCLVHEAADFPGGGRVYLHRWVWFDAAWRMRKISRPFVFNTRGIEFAAGLAQRGDALVIAYGVGDREAWLATIGLADVRAVLGVVSPETVAKETGTRSTSRVRQLPAGALDLAWWEASFQSTVDAYDQGDATRGLDACEHLLETGELPPAIEKQTRRNAVFYAPLLAEVAPSFAARMIDFPVPDQWTRYNASVAADPDGNLRMVVRSSNYEHHEQTHRTIVHDDHQVTRTVNYLLELDDLLDVVTVRTIDDRSFLRDPPPLPVSGFEDCRLLFVGGSWWVSATVWDHTPGKKGQIALLRLEGATAVEMHILSDGITQHEKNWMPVQDGDADRIQFIYSCCPTVLLTFDGLTGPARVAT